VHADAGGTARLYAGGRFQLAGGFCTVVRRGPGGWNAVGPLTWSHGAEVHALAEYELTPGTTVLHAGGEFSQAGGVPCSNVARWNGTSWEPLGAGVDGEVRALATFVENGGPMVLIAGGAFMAAGGASAARIARWNASAWSPLHGGISPSGPGTVLALLPFDPDDAGPMPQELFVGGDFSHYGDAQGVTHLASNTALWSGTAWSAMSGDPSGRVRAFGAFDDGSGERVWCAGGLGQYPNINGEPNALEWTGTRWRSVGRGLDGPVFGLATWDDDGPGPHPLELYAAGDFTHAGDAEVWYLARFDGYDWRPLASTGIVTSATGMLPFDADGPGGAPDRLWIGMAGSIRTWDGAVLQTVHTGVPGESTTAFAVFDEGHGAGPQLFAGGDFDLPGFGENLGRWNGSAFELVDGGVDGHFSRPPVQALEVFDEDGPGPLAPALFVSGNITRAGSGSAAVHPPNNVVRWDGTAWSLVGTYSTNDDATDLTTFDFDGAGPDPARLCIAYGTGVFVWDGQAMTQLGGALQWTTALCVFDDGVNGPALYAAQGIAQPRLWRWSGTAWQPCGGYSDMQSGRINALHAYVEPRLGLPALVAGGIFVDVDVFQHLGPRVPSAYLGAWLGSGVSGAPVCLGDGSGTACPCGNSSLPGTASGCVNSLGAGGKLVCTGTPSLMSDMLSLVGTQMTNSSALYFQGTSPVNGGLGSVFGDGLRCAGGSIVRLATRQNVSGASGYPAPGEPSISQRGQVAVPGSRLYQVWYRNPAPFCTSGTFNLTNSWVVEWTM
jgi:hypothetical protein